MSKEDDPAQRHYFEMGQYVALSVHYFVSKDDYDDVDHTDELIPLCSSTTGNNQQAGTIFMVGGADPSPEGVPRGFSARAKCTLCSYTEYLTIAPSTGKILRGGTQWTE